MISAGKTIEVKVGRQILCKENPSTPATSKCAKKLKATVTVAKKGLTAKQQKLWRKYVYTPALLQARRFCTPVFGNAAAEGGATKAELYSDCVLGVLSGKTKIYGLFKTEFKWSDFLIKGAKMIKKLPTPIRIKVRGTNPNGDFGTQKN